LPWNVVVDVPLNVPRIPAGSCHFPPGLGPGTVANVPPYVLAAQKRARPRRQTRTERGYVSSAHVFPWMPVSASFCTPDDIATTGLPLPQSEMARTTGTRSPPMQE